MQWSKAKKLKFLADAPVIRVATADRRGRPQVTPVCPVVSKEKIYWASDEGTAKVENISRHRSVALVADVYKSTWHNMGGVMAQGTARLLRRGPRFREIRDLLYKKFKPYRTTAAFDEGEAVIVEVTPTHLASWWFQ